MCLYAETVGEGLKAQGAEIHRIHEADEIGVKHKLRDSRHRTEPVQGPACCGDAGRSAKDVDRLRHEPENSDIWK